MPVGGVGWRGGAAIGCLCRHALVNHNSLEYVREAGNERGIRESPVLARSGNGVLNRPPAYQIGGSIHGIHAIGRGVEGYLVAAIP